ncbi:hypothetical protein [Xenorhabdus budapestensis]|uniref:Phage-like protein n=1 Tax=Xenorhabdus budapestensis TaxID=290110 RepID=A0A2D0IYB3_XENBU|nr:hypothetical protein [Xenorhabdus budapestensis]PHM26923.1 phage-like protein [Xenorhabdus budapestensis]QTL39257.1 hypothetical protein HGO23_15730 [Xenorhabdus budapestensis]
MNQLPPEAKSLDYWIKDEENVTLPDLLSKKIDDQVKTSPNLYKNRSHFLQMAALHELQNGIQQ